MANGDWVPVSLPVRLYGVTEQGKTISCITRICAVSTSAVRLERVSGITLCVGDIMGLDHNGRKSRGKIVSTDVLELAFTVGDVGALGIDYNSLRASSPSSTRRQERRTSHRYRCEIGVRLRAEGFPIELNARCTDISRTGCYLEMPSALEVGLPIQVRLATTHGDELSVQAVVRTCHPGVGMGIEFTQAPRDLVDLIEFWAHGSGKYAKR